MAIYKVEAPDGSIIELEGPDNATDAQIGQAAQAAFAQRQTFNVQTQAGQNVAVDVRFPDAAQAPAQQPSVLQELGRQVGLTGRGAIEGVTGLAGIVIDPVTRLANIALPATAQIPTMQQATAQVLDTAGFPQPRNAVERMVNQAVQGVSSGGGMAAAGRVAQMSAAPVTSEVGRMLAAQPVAQMAGGAGAGAAGQAVRESGGTPTGEIAASLLGGIAGGAAASRAMAPTRTPTTPTLQPVINEAARRNVPVMTSDVVQPETFVGKAAQRIGERIPIAGTGPVRAEQQKARIDSVRDILRDYGADDAANLSDDIMKDLATKRSADRVKYTGTKREVIDRLDSQGVVPMTNTVKKIDDIIGRLTKENTEASLEAAARLETIKGTGPTGASGRTLSQIEAFRRDELANAFKDDPTRPISIAARDVGEKAMREIYDPVRKDMGDFIKATGERQDFNKWMVSNKRLEELSNELKMTSLKSVLKSGDATSEVVNRLLFSQKPSEVRQLYTSLTPVGRANARSSILSQAAQKAQNDMPDGSKIFSPEKFNAEIKRLQPQIGVFFRGDDLKRVEGLSRILTLTRRAGEAGVATPTGQEAVPFIAGGALQSFLGSFGASVAAAGGIGLAARIYESAPVRNLMMQLGTTKRGSSEEAAIAKRLISTIETQSESIQSKTQDANE
jgi:hypothetical protein